MIDTLYVQPWENIYNYAHNQCWRKKVAGLTLLASAVASLTAPD